MNLNRRGPLESLLQLQLAEKMGWIPVAVVVAHTPRDSAAPTLVSLTQEHVVVDELWLVREKKKE